MSDPQPARAAAGVEQVKVTGQVAIDHDQVQDYRNVRVYIVPAENIRVPDSDGRFDKVELKRQVQAPAIVVYNGQVIREQIIEFDDRNAAARSRTGS